VINCFNVNKSVDSMGWIGKIKVNNNANEETQMHIENGIKKVRAGQYRINHDHGSCFVERNDFGKWLVLNECTGHIYETAKTKASAIDYVVDHWGSFK